MLSLPLVTLISACDQALWDIQAQAQALPLCVLLSLEPADDDGGRQYPATERTFPPHNPSGPICDAVSAHASMLEMQFNETPLFAAFIGGETKAVERGKVAIFPTALARCDIG